MELPWEWRTYYYIRKHKSRIINTLPRTRELDIKIRGYIKTDIYIGDKEAILM